MYARPLINEIDDIGSTSIDFSLVKYDTMFRYITIEEVLVPIMKDLPKDQHGYTDLQSLRNHDQVF